MQRSLAVAALALAVRNAFVAYENNVWHVVATGKGSALVFYPFAAAAHTMLARLANALAPTMKATAISSHCSGTMCS